jgi:hypothetical protein
MPLISEADLEREIGRSLASRRPAAGAGRAADAGVHRPGTAPARPRRGTLLPLADALAARRSVREFAASPLPRADLEFLLAHPAAEMERVWPAATARPSFGLVTLVIAARVTGLDAGVYTSGEAAGMARLADIPESRALYDLYAPAPVLFAICGDVGWATSAEGPGYGGLLVAAGALGHATWLSALSAGYAASVYGGAAEELTHVARRAGLGLRHLFTVAAGRPAATGGAS